MLRMFRCIIDNEFSFPGPGLRSISPASKSKRHNTVLYKYPSIFQFRLSVGSPWPFHSRLDHKTTPPDTQIQYTCNINRNR